jgi:RNA-directed DNA polymerase
MTGNSSIDISVANIWRSYRAFRRGKKLSPAIKEFEYQLLDNILHLASSIQQSKYKHGSYAHMIVNDNKRRDIAVATVRDRAVHRLLYDYLVPIWDRTFIYDAWSCRQGKGLHSAIERAQLFMRRYPDAWLWRADITKLFDSVDKPTLKRLIRRRVQDPVALRLLDEVVDSYSSFSEERGIPIGNLTSQILANVYLNEFDRFIKHQLKPYAYLRYGDDWLCFAKNKQELEGIRKQAVEFLAIELRLTVHKDIDTITPVKRGVSYLGVDMWSTGRRLDKDAQNKIKKNLNIRNVSSYKSLTRHHQPNKYLKRFEWTVRSIIDQE